MKRISLLCGLLLVGSQFQTLAADSATAANKEAAARYEADKKLCGEEATSTARMQCLRDAKAEYDKAAAAPAEKTAPSSKVACVDCGKVTDVQLIEKKGESGPIGLIGGGVAGALLGHQIGGGSGKSLATIAGAAGGAYAGHKIEEKVNASKVWSVRVRLESGEDRTFEFDRDPGLAVGDPVKLSGSSVVRR